MIKRRKILHIEDDAIVRDLVKTILERANYDVISVDDTIKGIEVAGTEIPNLIIMDLNMPGLNGYEATTRLKSIDKIRDVPIIALTGEDTHDESIIAGCDGYLKKPINVRTFPQQISEFLTRKKVTLRHPELESDYLKEYSSKLVARMQEKVEELQNTNRRLDDYTRTLEEYNKKLFKLNEVSNKLQTFISGDELLKFLPREICSELEFDRCFIFLVDRRELKLKLRYFYGDPELKEQKNFSIVESDLLLKRLLIYQELFWVNEELLQSMSEYRESPFTKIGFGEFFISPLAKNVIYEVNPMKPKEKTPLSILEEIRNEKFPVRHLLYVDNIPESNSPFSENDVRILRELVQTIALTYDNIELVRNLEQLYHQAERFAITDGLTGLYNYRRFQEELDKELKRAKRHNSNLSLVIIDIDFFKHYNDTHGHPAGDVVLKQVSYLLNGNTRVSDIVARYGGEEFCIILPETDKQSALLQAEKTCEIIAKAYFPEQEQQPNGNLTISLGIATYPEDAGSPAELIRNADLALYEAKHEGKNRVCVYDPSLREVENKTT